MNDMELQMNGGMQPNNLQNNPFNEPQPYQQQQPYQPQPYQPQPMYMAPPPPPPMQPNPMNNPMNMPPSAMNMHPHPMNMQQYPNKNNPTMIIVSNPSYPPCPFCHHSGPTTARRVTGQAQIFWCFILFLLFPIICCIPFCMSGCDDVHYNCSSCGKVVNVVARPIC